MAKSGFAAGQLRSFVERIERLEEEKASLAVDISEVYAEAKGTGFDTKIMRQIIKLRKMEAADRQEQEAILDLYKVALGMSNGGDRTLPAEAALAEEVTRPLPQPPGSRKTFEAALVQDNAVGTVGVMGRSVEPTEEEREKGVVLAFESKDGTRSSIAFPKDAASAEPVNAAPVAGVDFDPDTGEIIETIPESEDPMFAEVDEAPVKTSSVPTNEEPEIPAFMRRKPPTPEAVA